MRNPISVSTLPSFPFRHITLSRRVRRQLFLRIDDNYFSLSTTITP